MNYLVCYDISNNKRRLKLSKLLDNFGDRVQESVFELPALDADAIQACIRKIEKVKLEGGETIRLYSLCEACKKGIIIFGDGEAMSNPDVYII